MPTISELVEEQNLQDHSPYSSLEKMHEQPLVSGSSFSDHPSIGPWADSEAFMTIAIPTLTLLVYFFMLAPMVDTLHDVSSAMCDLDSASISPSLPRYWI